MKMLLLSTSNFPSTDATMYETRTLETCDPVNQESLVSENVPDLMDAEQTWPTEEEMVADSKKKLIKRVPQGTSEYQAAWIPDSDAGM